MATKKKESSGAAKAWGIGGAITAATVAAAAAAYLLSDKKTQTKAKAWVSKAKIEVAKHAKTAKKLGEKEYNAIVDQAVKKYGSLENITAGDVVKAGKDLKSQWTNIQKHAQNLVKSAQKETAPKKSTAKKAITKKAAKKSAKKS
jgi:hypothetical protein